jgi:hypothetical protein
MAQSRYYSATAQPTVLTAGITNATTVINVLAATGFPASTPFILALDYNTPSEEIVLVTIQAGTNLTVTRAYDGTSATSHNAGAGVRHTWTAMDGNDSRAHEAASTGVHGLAIGSAVVGVNDTQTLLSKTLTAPAINGNIGGTSSFVNVNGHLGGLTAGSTSQFAVDVNGRPSSTTFISAYTEDTTTRTTTSLTYADVSLLSTTIVVPPSGKVYVSGQVRHGLTASGAYGYSAINVTGTISGSLHASSDNTAAQTGYPTLTVDTTQFLGFIITSANVGETLTVKWQHRLFSAGPTYNLYYRNISVIPLMG